MNKINAKTITINALAIAIVCISTMFIQIPIPLGYMHLGNCCILLAAIFFGRTTGFIAGGIGSAQIPGLSLEGGIGIVLFYVIGFGFEAAKLPKILAIGHQ